MDFSKKLKALQDCHNELKVFLEREKVVSARNSALENQLLEFGTAIATLQRSLSDTQAQLNYERTLAKQLQIENHYVKYKLREQDKAIKTLSHLLGAENVAVKALVRNPGVQELVGRKGAAIERIESTSVSSGTSKETAEGTDDEQTDTRDDPVLGRELEKMRNVAKEMGAVFLRDREIIQEEREAERNLMSEKLRKLNDELLSTQEALRDVTGRYTQLRVSDATSVKGWESEKLGLLKKMKSISSVASNEDAKTVVESLVDILDPQKHSMVVARLKKEVNELRELVDEATNIAEQYRTKCVALQRAMDELRSDCEEMISKSKSEADSSKAQLTKALERCSRLEDKTKMEFAGYKNEIALLKEELRRAEKKLYFLTLKQNL